MASITDGERTLPLFLINNELPAFDKKSFTTAEICAAAEKVCGHNKIDGAQRIGSLWRIYPCNKDSRQKLLLQGFSLRGVHISVKSQNPYIVRNLTGGVTGDREEQPPATKLVISNVPLSFSDEDVLQTVKQLGVSVRSKLILERDRDERGKLTHWKTGRRFLYIGVPSVPLEKTVQIGPFRATLYHKEQKLNEEQQEAECRNCLRKGHRNKDCPNPIKCRQCYCDGHKAGDPVCSLNAGGGRDGSTDCSSTNTQTTDRAGTVNFNSGEKSKQNPTKKYKTQNSTGIMDSNDRSRPREKKKQTTLNPYRRSGSGSVKRPRSEDSTVSQSEKQQKLLERTEYETEDDETEYCEVSDHTG